MGVWGDFIQSSYLDTVGLNAFYLDSVNWLSASYGAKSAVNSLILYNYHRFNLASRSKVYFVIHARSANNVDVGVGKIQPADIIIRINWQLAKPTFCPAPANNTWYRHAFKCPNSDNMEIAFQATDVGVSIDKLWLIAKP